VFLRVFIICLRPSSRDFVFMYFISFVFSLVVITGAIDCT